MAFGDGLLPNVLLTFTVIGVADQRGSSVHLSVMVGQLLLCIEFSAAEMARPHLSLLVPTQWYASARGKRQPKG